MKKVKNLVIYGVVSTIMLSGCSISKEDSKLGTYSTYETNQNVLNGNYQEGEIKVFEPYSHYFSVRQSYDNGVYFNDITVINNIPDGYQIYSILPETSHHYRIWFVNTKEVECTATNDGIKTGFYTFGKVIENTKTMN